MRCVPLIFPEVLIHQLQPRHGSTLATLDVISKDHVTPLILFDLRCALRSCRLGDVISTSRNFPAGLTDIFDIIYIYIYLIIFEKNAAARMLFHNGCKSTNLRSTALVALETSVFFKRSMDELLHLITQELTFSHTLWANAGFSLYMDLKPRTSAP